MRGSLEGFIFFFLLLVIPFRLSRRYAAAEQEAIPPYRAESAKSGRSGCKARKHGEDDPAKFIDKGELRVGSFDSESGAYSRWYIAS